MQARNLLILVNMRGMVVCLNAVANYSPAKKVSLSAQGQQNVALYQAADSVNGESPHSSPSNLYLICFKQLTGLFDILQD